MDYVERTMNIRIEWDNNVKGDVVVGPVVCVGREEVMK